MPRPFRTVLVANRGEIAMRVLRTVKAMGLRGAMVYHAADRDAPAVTAADLAIPISGSTPVSAYLDANEILRAATQANADAIHPGYGFLSENAAFARRVADAGMVFIGPEPEAIELMGDKVRARGFVERRGFPVAPSAIEDDDPPSFTARAAEGGFPLLINPSAGGGGKGMRIVREAGALDDEITRALSEGQRYFGDGRLYVERYVERPRHIEVQVLGDAHGNVVHLWERECSVQRRFQKIIEETPSPALSPQMRQRICETAAGIARAAGYRNAGTVKFIFGGGEFYFLEMNTRLQVEHPVTEMITGVDLVAEQIAIAANRPLSFRQPDISAQGHAIEARLYAESPERGFSPTSGKVLMLGYPHEQGVRVDSGITQGQSITTAFDPMLAKVIVHAPTRDAAVAKAMRAVQDVVLLGCETNAAFLARVLGDAGFRSGEVHTGYLDENPTIASGIDGDPDEVTKLLAVAAMVMRPVRDAADAVPALHPAIGDWRN